MPKMTMRFLPALLTAAFAGPAAAAGFQLWEQNASGIGVAYAGSAAVADNASTIFYNPAGMTQLPGVRLSLGVAGARTSFKFRNEGSGPQTGGNGGDAGGWTALPNAYLSWQVGQNLFLGLGVSSPFGLTTKYDDANWIGRYQALKSEITTVNVNPSLAYRLNDKVSLGFGLNYQRIDAEMTKLVIVPGPATTNYSLKGDASTWGWNGGALFTLSPAMRVGVSYRSAIKHELEGDRTVGGVTTSAKANLKLPDTFILSVWQQVSEQWEAMGDLSYTHWSTVDKLNIVHAVGTDVENFNYRDSWRFAWGAAYKASDAWKAKFGVAYDRTPTTNGDRSARVPDNNRIWLSVGGQWKPSRDAAVDFGYAYLYLHDPRIDQTAGTANLRGRYNDSAHILGVQYSQGF
ncbi:MAG: Membrane protein involved in aromatic hydrocarbon degradation [Rhodocyclaceae bacterium]|nr:Membrane protein involved in aromatic hydrocarbon degradation [Rhodocyclaceae bacterium]